MWGQTRAQSRCIPRRLPGIAARGIVPGGPWKTTLRLSFIPPLHQWKKLNGKEGGREGGRVCSLQTKIHPASLRICFQFPTAVRCEVLGAVSWHAQGRERLCLRVPLPAAGSGQRPGEGKRDWGPGQRPWGRAVGSLLSGCRLELELRKRSGEGFGKPLKAEGRASCCGARTCSPSAASAIGGCTQGGWFSSRKTVLGGHLSNSIA